MTAAKSSSGASPLVMHLLYRFDTGGLENGVVNLINHLPEQAYRHVVVALDEVQPDFARRIKRSGVRFVSLHKPPGQTWWIYSQLYRLFRDLKPTILHTRNLAALECSVPAWAARVPIRIHGEHGRDVGDLDGSRRRYQLMRRIYKPFVHQYVALSRDLESYLTGQIQVSAQRVQRICNGVDSVRFQPRFEPRFPLQGCPFTDPNLWLIGTVGRMQAVKNQTHLARAFVDLLQRRPDLKAQVRLVMVGDGPLRAESQATLDAAGLGGLAWLPGERSDVADVMSGLDCFVLPSVAEGISNTILEAMACGLPVLAASVGGNADLVRSGHTGWLVSSDDLGAMSMRLEAWAEEPLAAAAMGQAGRVRVEQEFSLQAMVAAHQDLYERLLARHAPRR